jgi:hypothetical protein
MPECLQSKLWHFPTFAVLMEANVFTSLFSYQYSQTHSNLPTQTIYIWSMMML